MNDANANSSMLLPILKKIPLFAGLDENSHKEIINRIMLMYYPADYQLFKEGDPGTALYILKKGKVSIYHDPKEEGDLPQKVAEINEGGFLGEMALVSEQPRNASAKTLSESEVFILSKEDFKRLLATNTVLAEQISATVIDRLKENDQTNK